MRMEISLEECAQKTRARLALEPHVCTCGMRHARKTHKTEIGFLIIQSGRINDHVQRNVLLIYISKSWSKHHSMSSRFRIHLYVYPSASTAAAGSFLCRALSSFPLPSSCQRPSSGTPPHDVHTAHYGNIALEPVPLPLPFRTFRSDSSLSSVSPVSSSL